MQPKLSATLRPATPDDGDFLLRLFSSARPEFGNLNLDDSQKDLLIKMQFNAQTRQYAMNYPDARNSIIVCNDEPIGRLLLDRGESEFTLVDVALLPNYRGTGIGTGLIQDIVKEAWRGTETDQTSCFNFKRRKTTLRTFGILPGRWRRSLF